MALMHLLMNIGKCVVMPIYTACHNVDNNRLCVRMHFIMHMQGMCSIAVRT